MARLFLLLLVLQLTSILAKQVVQEFQIHPGTDGKVSVALDTPPIASSTCVFEWSAMGATPEAWTTTISGDPSSGDLECLIERAGGANTYLMFQSFKTTLGTAPVLDAEVHGNEGKLSSDEAVVDGECVRNHHEWSGGEIRSILLKSAVEY